MAWTTPGTATAGEVLTAAFWNTQVRDNMNMIAPLMSTFSTWTPTVNQGATTNIATSTKVARYVQVGKLVFGWYRVIMSAAGTGANAVTLSLPATAADNSTVAGGGWIYDDSAAIRYNFSLELGSTTTVQMVGDWSAANAWGVTPNIALASGDQMRGFVIYEAA